MNIDYIYLVFVFILICEWWWWLNGMDNHWIHAAISNNYVPVLVVVMAVVFVIAKVESCICQSNRLENLMTISIVIHTKIWEHFELHTHTNTQVANWFQIICWMKKWHPKWIAHFDRINLRTQREREKWKAHTRQSLLQEYACACVNTEHTAHTCVWVIFQHQIIQIFEARQCSF